MEHEQIIITSNNQIHNTQEYMSISIGGNGVFIIGDKITIHGSQGVIIGEIVDQSTSGDYLICEVK